MRDKFVQKQERQAEVDKAAVEIGKVIFEISEQLSLTYPEIIYILSNELRVTAKSNMTMDIENSKDL